MINQTLSGLNPKNSDGPNNSMHPANPNIERTNRNFLEVCSQVYGSNKQATRYTKAGSDIINPTYSL